MIRCALTTLLCACICIATTDRANAQEQVDGISAKQLVADSYVRSAVALMGYSQAVESDTPNDLAVTALDAALELDPDNAQAWAMRVELAKLDGDAEEQEKILSSYLETGIRDDRASYELVRLRLAKAETLDAQYKVLQQLLDSEAGRALAQPLRSRLASYASGLAHELLDEPGRRKWAVEAARADPANAEAADTMLGLVLELGGDEVRQAAALVNVIRARPLDPAPRLQLAGMLADQAAYQAAAIQYRVVATRLSTQPLPMQAYLSWAQCLAITGQDELAMQLIDEFDKALNQPPQEQAGGEAEIEQAPLPLELELVKLAVMPDQSAAQEVFDKAVARVRESAAASEDEKAKVQAEDQLALLAAVFSPDLAKAEQIATEYKQSKDAKKWVTAISQGWLQLRRGNKKEAQELLGPVAERHSLASCGLAMATGQDDIGRAKLIQQVLRDVPAMSPASLAAGRALKAIDQAPIPSAPGQAVLNLMSKYPSSFWRVDVEAVPWIEARFVIDPARIKPLQPLTAQVTVWNTTRFPIALGDDSPVKPSAVITIDASTSGRPIPPVPPIVVSLNQRFTLAAGERLVFDTRLDYHQFGLIRQGNPNTPLVFNAKFVVNPVPSRAGSWQPSGIGRSAEVRNCLIEASPPNQASINQWVASIDAEGNTRERLHAVERLASLSPKAQPDLVNDELIAQIKPKLLAWWDKANDDERAWMVLNANGIGQPDTLYPELLERIKASDSEVIWLAMLMSQVDSKDSPLLSEAVRRQDLTDVSRYAEKLRRLLREIEALEEKNAADPVAEPEPAK